MTSKKNTPAKKTAPAKKDEAQVPELTAAERHEALAYALGADSKPDGTTTYYTGESVVEVRVTKRALGKGEDPREP